MFMTLRTWASSHGRAYWRVRLCAVVDDHHLDIALPRPLGDSLDDLFGRRAREVFSRLCHIWVSSYILAWTTSMIWNAPSLSLNTDIQASFFFAC